MITVSAAYGVGGTAIARTLADRLGLPFLDRAIPAGVARSLAVPLEQAVERDEHRPSVIDRIIMAMAAGGSAYGVTPMPPTEGVVFDEATFQAQTERVILDQADSGAGGVVIGRAGVIVLAGHPRLLLRVRLAGAADRRARIVAERTGLPEAEAAKLVERNDRAVHDYVRHFYRHDIADPALYDIVLDATTIPEDACVDIVAAAAEACATRSTAAPS